VLHNGPFLIRGPILQFWGIAHTNYLMQRSNERAAHVDFEPVGGVASTSARKLGMLRLAFRRLTQQHDDVALRRRR
jgi:hypothetical protein